MTLRSCPLLLIALCCFACAGLAACGDDAEGPSNNGAANGTTSANAGTTSTNSSTSTNNASTSTNAGTTSTNNATTPDDLPTDPEAAMETPELDSARPLSDLTTPELEVLCLAQERLNQSLNGDRQRFACLADAVDASTEAPDPAFTCGRLHDACMTLVELQEQLPDLTSDPPIESCMFAMRTRTRQACTDPTVGAYKSCVLNNLALETAVLDRRDLTCAEAVEQVSIRPQGIFDCACGVEARVGPTPEDDDDWDYVPNADDICPGTDVFYAPTDYGCSEYQDADQDRVWDEEDLCPNTERDAPEISPRGCSRAQDDDFDDLPGYTDPCPGTEDGAELVTPGCSIAQDEDADGVPNRADWCPFTSGDEAPDNRGCAASQGEPWNDPYLNALPDGTEQITLGADQDGPTHLFYLPSGVSNATSERFDYSGTLLLEMGEGRYMQLPDSQVTFDLGQDAQGSATTIRGVTQVPFPGDGIFEGFRPDAILRCDVGYGPGNSQDIAAQELPVDPSRKYMFFTCGAGLSGSIGPIELSAPQSADVFVLLDPFDPALYLRGNIDGLRPFNAINDAGVAISAQGLIPFEPAQTWGVEDLAQPFDAHLFAYANVPIPQRYPILAQLLDFELEGDLFFNLDPNADGPLSFDAPDLRFGGNGRLIQRMGFFGLFDMQIDMTEATFGGTLNPSGSSNTYFSGVAVPDSIHFFVEVPIAQVAEARVAGAISDDPSLTRFVADAWFRVLGEEINLPFIPDLFDFDLNGRVEITEDGVHVLGSTSGDVHPWIQINGEASVEFAWAFDRSAFYIRLQGNFVFDDAYEATDIYLGKDDIRLNGESLFDLLDFFDL